MKNNDLVIKKPRYRDHFEALSRTLQSNIEHISTLIDHGGEKGRLVEDLIRQLLRQVVPGRFALGTGFVFNSRGDVSSQNDIVLYDHLTTSPIFASMGASLYPVECVMAAIEVKMTLRPSLLTDSLRNIKKFRAVGEHQRLIYTQIVETRGKANVASFPSISSTPPRSYVVAYRTDKFGSKYDTFIKKVEEIINSNNEQIHGILVIKNDWFVQRVAGTGDVKLIAHDKRGVERFIRAVFDDQFSFMTFPPDLSAYLAD